MALSILLHPPTALWRREALAASRGTFWVRMDGASSLRIYTRRRVSPRSASWDMTCSRSSSPIVNATVSAMTPLRARGGHFYFGETGHLHLGLTVGGLIGRVT